MPTPMQRRVKSSGSGLSWTPRVKSSVAWPVASRRSSAESHKTNFVPHLDVGDHVVVVNAERVHLTGRKLRDKVYRWHSGYIGACVRYARRPC